MNDDTYYQCPSAIELGGVTLRCSFQMRDGEPWAPHRFMESHFNSSLTDDDGEPILVSWIAARPRLPVQHVPTGYRFAGFLGPSTRSGWNGADAADQIRALTVTTLGAAVDSEVRVVSHVNDGGDPALVVSADFLAYDDSHARRILAGVRQTASHLDLHAYQFRAWCLDSNPARELRIRDPRGTTTEVRDSGEGVNMDTD